MDKLESDDTLAAGPTPTLAERSAEGFDATLPSAGSAEGRDRPDDADLAIVDPKLYGERAELTRGGMGRITTARDRRLRRRVAIKELRVQNDELYARFAREALLTARLQHPSIVSIHEAGRWPSGEPFFAMELVPGRSLDKEVAAADSLAGRLALVPRVAAVADAMAYAHSERVIHRDLKPHNVMIGRFGETVVIDWGLAKDLAAPEAAVEVTATSRAPDPVAGSTEHGEVLGTPAYMPPEQARGEIVDERADVYAIGAMLYHVLSGEPPYIAPTSVAVVEAVRQGPPRSIRDRVTGVAPDLLAIVDRAMARDPASRYPTAGELADDLRRFQTGQLVGAHRYTRRQLVGRWLRRHRAVVAAAAISVTVLVGLGVLGLRAILQERDRAEASRAEAEDLVGFVLLDLRTQLEPINRLDLLGDVADKTTAYYSRNAPRTTDERHARALAHRYLGDVLGARGDSAAALVEYRVAEASAPTDHDRALARRNIGDVLRAQDVPGALVEYRAAQAILAERAAQEPHAVERQADLSMISRRIGAVLLDRGDTSGALAEYRTALAIAVRLVAARPHDVSLMRSLVLGRTHIGDALFRHGDSAGALVEYRAAVEMQEALVARDPGNTDLRHGVAMTRERIGGIHEKRGRSTEALAEYRAVLAILVSLERGDPTNTKWKHGVALAHDLVGDVLEGRGEHALAMTAYRDGLAIRDRLAALDTSNTDWREQVAASHERIGGALRRKGDVQQAIAEARIVLDIRSAVAERDLMNAERRRNHAAARVELGNLLVKAGDVARALVELRAARGLLTALVARDPDRTHWRDDLAICHEHLATALSSDQDAALIELRAALALRRGLAERDPTNARFQATLAIIQQKIGDLLFDGGNVAGALVEYDAILAIVDPLVVADPANLDAVVIRAVVLERLGDVRMQQADPAGALVKYRDALAANEAIASGYPSNVEKQRVTSISHEKIGEALVALRDPAGAAKAYRAALAIADALAAANPTSSELREEASALRKTLSSCCRLK